MQSVLIGVFNFFDMLTLRNFKNADVKEDNDETTIKAYSKTGCLPWFFLLHYGLFHLAYLVFLTTIINIKKLDFKFIELSFAIILIACTASFIQNKIRNRTEDVSIDAMFFMPYARIIPMHLMILLPNFFNISGAAIFLVLKTFADIVMHYVYTKAVFKPVAKSN